VFFAVLTRAARHGRTPFGEAGAVRPEDSDRMFSVVPAPPARELRPLGAGACLRARGTVAPHSRWRLAIVRAFPASGLWSASVQHAQGRDLNAKVLSYPLALGSQNMNVVGNQSAKIHYASPDIDITDECSDVIVPPIEGGYFWATPSGNRSSVHAPAEACRSLWRKSRSAIRQERRSNISQRPRFASHHAAVLTFTQPEFGLDRYGCSRRFDTI
jgi:hypothetical protein